MSLAEEDFNETTNNLACSHDYATGIGGGAIPTGRAYRGTASTATTLRDRHDSRNRASQPMVTAAGSARGRAAQRWGRRSRRRTGRWGGWSMGTNPNLVARLGLTDDQKTRIERAFENHRQD